VASLWPISFFEQAEDHHQQHHAQQVAGKFSA
jgi:hypothetical protein